MNRVLNKQFSNELIVNRTLIVSILLSFHLYLVDYFIKNLFYFIIVVIVIIIVTIIIIIFSLLFFHSNNNFNIVTYILNYKLIIIIIICIRPLTHDILNRFVFLMAQTTP